MSQLRKDFVDILDKIQQNTLSKDEWHHWMVNHYHDREIEDIRREIVRLSIEGTLYSDIDKSKIEEWRKALLD
jgi:hypothetical protein